MSHPRRIVVAFGILVLPYLLGVVGAGDFILEVLDETWITFVAVSLELGIPLGALACTIRSPNYRKFSLPILGSTISAPIVAGRIAWEYVAEPEQVAWAFAPVALMGLYPFILLASAGTALAISLPKGLPNLHRFLLGLLLAPGAAYLGIFLLGQIYS